MKKTVSYLLATLFLFISFPLYAGISIDVLRPATTAITDHYPSIIFGEVKATSDVGSIVSVVFEVENETFEGKPQGGNKYSFYTHRDQGSYNIKVTATDSLGNSAVVNHPVTLYVRCVDELYSAEKAYLGGDRVSFENRIYEAKWWTQGETPGSGSTWEAVYECTFNEAPVIDLLSPTAEDFYLEGETIQVNADITDSAIEKVEISYGQNVVVKTSAPYTATFKASGYNTQVSIIAYDDKGASTTLRRMTYSRTYGQPFIKLTNVIKDNHLYALVNQPVTYKFEAFDTDGGTIEKIRLGCYGDILGEVYEAPFEITGVVTSAVNCNMIANVYDNDGNVSYTSFIASFLSEDPCADASSWKADAGYAKGDRVIFDGRVYTANQWSYNVSPKENSNYDDSKVWTNGSACVIQ